jgi:hypothetical protein
MISHLKAQILPLTFTLGIWDIRCLKFVRELLTLPYFFSFTRDWYMEQHKTHRASAHISMICQKIFITDLLSRALHLLVTDLAQTSRDFLTTYWNKKRCRRWRINVPPKLRLPTRPHGITNHKTIPVIWIVFRMKNLGNFFGRGFSKGEILRSSIHYPSL